MNRLSSARSDLGAMAWRFSERARVKVRDAIRTVRHNGLLVPVSIDVGELGRILVIDMQIPRTDRNAGDRNIVDFMGTFIEAGWDVTYWPRSLQEDFDYSDILRRIGIEVVAGAARPSLTAWLRVHRPSLRHAVVCRPTVAAAYLRTIRQYADVPITYYGHDLHFARTQMEADVLGRRKVRNSAAKMESLERWVWSQADMVIYPSMDEVAQVKSRNKAVGACAVPIFRFDNFSERQSMPSTRQVLFVGSFRRTPNIDGAVWLAREIWPRVRRGAPDARLLIVGANPPQAVTALAGNEIEVPGAVSHEQLASLYAGSRVAAVPLRVGAGMKLKTVESLALGVPLVTTSVGAQGLSDLETVSQSFDTAEEFAAETIRLLTLDEGAWLRQSRKQVNDAKGRFGATAMRDALSTTLTLAENAYTRRAGKTHLK